MYDLGHLSVLLRSLPLPSRLGRGQFGTHFAAEGTPCMPHPGGPAKQFDGHRASAFRASTAQRLSMQNGSLGASVTCDTHKPMAAVLALLQIP
jgi:hypothetical protein